MEEAATVAAEIDALQFGNALRFVNELQTALKSTQRELESRQTDARKSLPDLDQNAYHEYRMKHDERYRKQKAGEALQAKQIAHRVAENERRYGGSGHVPKRAVTNDDGYIVGYR